jgi:ubiquinone/menaquinone biosynthesis C-methylase UbiE
VLEIGCGTGKLTEALARQGLHVEAVDPGERMIEVARRRVGGPARHLPGRALRGTRAADGEFAAAFSATAFHWIDPSVGWAKVARVLQPGGTFAWSTCRLLAAGRQLHAVWTEVRPDSLQWVPRDRETLFAGTEASSEPSPRCGVAQPA